MLLEGLLHKLIHEYFSLRNIAPVHNKELLLYSCQLPNNQKYDYSSNSGKIILVNLLQKLNIKSLVSLEKQGFSVNTVNLWNSYGKRIFLHFFDKSRLVEDKIISSEWVDKHISKNNLDTRYVNKFLGILALEIWYRIFITNEVNPDEKLDF